MIARVIVAEQTHIDVIDEVIRRRMRMRVRVDRSTLYTLLDHHPSNSKQQVTAGDTLPQSVGYSCLTSFRDTAQRHR